MTNVTLTTEQAQHIEEALEDIVRVFKFETGTPVEALAVIREARAEQEKQEPVAFETWWEEEGQMTLYALNTLTDADAKILAQIAWEKSRG